MKLKQVETLRFILWLSDGVLRHWHFSRRSPYNVATDNDTEEEKEKRISHFSIHCLRYS